MSVFCNLHTDIEAAIICRYAPLLASLDFIRRTVEKLNISYPDRAYKSSAVAEMGDRGHSRQGPKRGGLLCLFRGELGPRLAQCCLGRRLLPYQVASSSIQPFGTSNMGQKLGGGGYALFSGGIAGSPSITNYVAWADGLPPYQVPY